MPLLRRSEKENEVVDEEAPCFFTDDSPDGKAGQPKHCDTVIVFWSSTKVETRTEHTTPSTVLDVDEEPVAPDPFTAGEFLQSQRDDKCCQQQAESTRDRQSCFDYDQHVILVQRAKLADDVQRVVSERFSHRLLHPAHYLLVARHPSRARMYYTLKYSAQMLSGVFLTVRICQDRSWQLKHTLSIKS